MAATVKTIAFVAGKSGGHIIPCISIMHHYYPEHKALFFTTDGRLDHTIMQQNAPHATHIQLPLNNSYTNIWYALPRLAWRLVSSFYRSVQELKKHNPERIISTGGLIALPVCLAAYFLGIPIDLYELNAIPGKSIKTLSRIATHIFVCFQETLSYFPASKCTVTEYPLRYNPNATYDKDAIRRSCGLNPNVPIIMIVGGSQGSVSLNNACKKTMMHRSQPIQVIHQTGSSDTTDWKTWYTNQGINAHVFTYISDYGPFLAIADVVMCRAGAGTLFEVLFFKKPCIIVPLEGLGDNHQVANAYAMQKQNPMLCTVLRQSTIQSNDFLLIQTIESILDAQTNFENKTSSLIQNFNLSNSRDPRFYE